VPDRGCQVAPILRFPDSYEKVFAFNYKQCGF
jgi:hypothetical protein